MRQALFGLKHFQTGTLSSKTIIVLIVLFILCAQYFTRIKMHEFDAEARRAVDPSKEVLRYSIGGVDFDITNDFSYEYAGLEGGTPAWPEPHKERKKIFSITLNAYIDGMKPWSKDLDGEFKQPGSLNVTRITITKNDNSRWLDNLFEARDPIKALTAETGYPELPGLHQFVAMPYRDSVFYIPGSAPAKPYFIIKFLSANRTAETNRFAYVDFDYTDDIHVHYLLPYSKLNEWKDVQDDVIGMLNSFSKIKGEK